MCKKESNNRMFCGLAEERATIITQSLTVDLCKFCAWEKLLLYSCVHWRSKTIPKESVQFSLESIISQYR